uniref:Mucin-5AC n=1 Tax=Phallusia mammillata TaxID=59560 RepID=A0A6F9DM71_9ASCI|nr:mucin-5AC [Phallusia mammillata]
MFTLFIMSCLVGVVTSSSSNETCTYSGVPCVFPFTYANKHYNSCVSDFTGLWCGIKPAIITNKEHVDWSYCKACPESQVTECTVDGYQCAWPYIDEHGHKHTTCLYHNGWFNKYYWCPIIHGYKAGGPEQGKCADVCPNVTKIYTTTPMSTTGPTETVTQNPKIVLTTTLHGVSTQEDPTTKPKLEKTTESTKVAVTQSTPQDTEKPLSTERTTEQPAKNTAEAIATLVTDSKNHTKTEQEARNVPVSIPTQSSPSPSNSSTQLTSVENNRNTESHLLPQANGTTQATIQSGSSSSALLLSLILVVVIVVIAVGIFFIRKRKFQKRDEPKQDTKSNGVTDECGIALMEQKKPNGEMKSNDPTEDTSAPLMVDESSPSKVQYVTTDSGFVSRGDLPQT